MVNVLFTSLSLGMAPVQVVNLFLLAEESSLQPPLLCVCLHQGVHLLTWFDQRFQLADTFFVGGNGGGGGWEGDEVIVFKC